MESLEDIAARALHVDMPTGRLVWNDKLASANEAYKAFYQRQNFDLRFGHMFPVYQPPVYSPKHTLRNSTALRVVL